MSKVLDLLSGLKGWSAAFTDRGHDVTTLDLDPRFGADHVRDLMTVGDLSELGGPFDVVLASPPCECFSVMTIGRNWNKDRTPKTERAAAALALAHHTFALIEAAKPKWYVVENPRGMLRKVAPRPPDATVWYCRYGAPYGKPTDLWTNLNGGMPTGWALCRPMGWDHEYAPRGSDAGTQRRTSSHGGNVALLGKEIVEAKKLPNGKWDRALIRSAIESGKRVVGWRIESGKRVLHHGHGNDLRHRTRFELTSGTRKAQRALIPYRLSLAVCLASERDGTLPSMDEVIATEAEPRSAA